MVYSRCCNQRRDPFSSVEGYNRDGRRLSSMPMTWRYYARTQYWHVVAGQLDRPEVEPMTGHPVSE